MQLGPDEDDIDEPLVVREGIAQFTSFLPPEQTEDLPPESRTPSPAIGQDSSEIKKNKKKGKHKRVANPWANKCMYAELLEMSDDPQFTESWSTDTQGSYHDGIPDDLESGWVALAPVPVGKRCLAVTMQSSGLGSVGTYSIWDTINNLKKISPTHNVTIASCGQSFTTSLPLAFASEHST